MYQSLIIGICCLLLSFSNDEVLLNETFSYPDGPVPGYFWSEGCPAVIKHGRLFIDADTAGRRAASVWLDKELKGDLSIEFDVYLVSSSDDANNINLFFMYGDPSGKPLRQSAQQREDGLYKRYHSLKGYIITNVTNGDTSEIRYRFRKNPGFKLVTETHGSRKNRKQPIHIKLIKKGNHIEYWEDQNKVFDVMNSDTLYVEGLFGFRTWHTSMEIDNLLIKRIF